MIVAGVMSGTSADGIDVALVRIEGATRVKFLAHRHFSYPRVVRRTVLRLMNAPSASVGDLARLNFLLGELYADAVIQTQQGARLKCALVGCHGQTLYHQGEPAKFAGKKLAVTWQTGEGAVIAARVGVAVVSDFRPADMAAGGKGAPLVPFFDYLVYRHSKIGRVALNIGGIANLTAIPAGAAASDVIAFDTGPGNMVIDAVTEALLGKSYDRDGRVAARGRVIDAVLKAILREAFFCARPPKTAGREEFGREFVERFLRRCRRAPAEDMVATATALTARSIADAIRRFALRRGRFGELIASGGGTKNRTLMSMLEAELTPLGLRLRRPEEFGIPSDAKEAVAFAVMAYETWHQRPSNVPSATGAKRAAVLGKISLG